MDQHLEEFIALMIEMPYLQKNLNKDVPYFRDKFAEDKTEWGRYKLLKRFCFALRMVTAEHEHYLFQIEDYERSIDQTWSALQC